MMNQGNEISVLHVDDEPDFAELTAEFLKREDERISVQTATSADEGMKHLDESDIDCIVSDYQMPGMNGIDFLETVREEHPTLPFILYTGKGSEEVASEAISSGVTDYLQKEGGSEDYTLLTNRIVNAVESQRQEQRLKFLETLENELTELSIDFLRTEKRDINALIDEGLETLGRLVEADRSYVFDIDPEAETLSNTHEWCADGVEPQIDMLQNLPLDSFPWWMRKLENLEIITIPNVSELPPESEALQEILQEQNIASLIVTPMISNGELVGFIGFDWVEEQEAWSDDFIDILRMASELIMTARRREARRQELERHEAYLEQSQDSITVVDEDGTVQFQSDSVEETTGFRSPEILGESGLEYVHPEDRQKATELFTSILGNPGETAGAELRVETKEGSWRWVDARGVSKLDDPVINGIVTTSRDITERKNREQELERMNDLFEQAQEIADLGAWETDLRNDEGWWTEQVNQIYGLPSGYEPKPGEGIEYFHPEDQPVIRDAFERAKEAGEPYDLELRVVDGEEIKWVRTRGKPQFEDGEVVRVRGTIQDITRRKEHEQELERYETLVEVSGDPMYMLDDEGCFTYVNEAFVETTGYSEEDLLGEDGLTVVAEDHVEKGEELFRSLLSEGEQHGTIELDIQTKTGEKIPAENHISLIYSDGEFQGSLGVLRDITDRMERERKLQRERDRLKTREQAVTALHDAARQLGHAETKQGIYDVLVAAAEEILDFALVAVDIREGDALVQKAWSLDQGEDGYYARISLDEDTLATRAYKRGETIIADDLRDYDITPADPEYLSALTVPIGDIGAFQTVAREVRSFDQTDRELAELLVGHAQEALLRLEHRASLREQRERLRRENERLETMASIISHDLRNPLTVAEGNVDLARQEFDSEKLEKANSALDRMNTLIEDVLTWAREGTHVSYEETSPIELREIAGDCWQNVEGGEGGLDVTTTQRVRAEESRLHHVFENLYQNAVQHGGEEVTIRIGDLEDGFYIEDDGAGIPPDERSQIFEYGYSTDEKGTGLGLNIVREIVEAHEWEIEVTESSEGGARFEITGVQIVDE